MYKITFVLIHIFREKLIHTNAIFNENGTLTYTANRSTIFLPELNTIDLNATLIMPNLGVLVCFIFYTCSTFNFLKNFAAYTCLLL